MLLQGNSQDILFTTMIAKVKISTYTNICNIYLWIQKRNNLSPSLLKSLKYTLKARSNANGILDYP